MPSLSPEQIAQLWERGQSLDPVRLAIMLLEGANLPTDAHPSDLPIGVRDAALYRMRVETFGDAFEAFTQCPACHAALELDVSDQAARIYSSTQPDLGSIVRSFGSASVEVRPLTSADLLEALSRSDGAECRHYLIESCTRWTVGQADAIDEATLFDAVETAIAEADPAAEVLLTLECPGCRHGWTAAFDVVTFLWNDIDRSARRLLETVHLIASNYGWDEKSILGLSPQRRQFYLDRILA